MVALSAQASAPALWTTALARHFGGGAVGTGCLSGSAPAPAAAAGFNCLVFADGPFTAGEIDTAHTGNAGFRWYPYWHPWTNAPTATSISTLVPDPVYNTDYSIDGSGNLDLTPSVDQFSNQLAIQSCVVNGSTWRGTTFTGPRYWKVTATWQDNGYTSGQGEAISWSEPVEMLTAGANATLQWIESDLVEPHFSGGNMNAWTISTPGGGQSSTLGSISQILTSGTPYGWLLATGGSLTFYANDTTATTQPFPAGYSDWSLWSSEHQCLWLGAAPAANNGNMIIERIEVWCANTSCMVQQ
jgi:hypothetical protein